MIRVVQDKFQLEQEPALEISTLDICGGVAVEVDESVYEIMAPVLDKIELITERSDENAGELWGTISHAVAD